MIGSSIYILLPIFMEDWELLESPDELTIEIIKHYLRIDHDLDDLELLMYLKSALSFTRKYVRMEDSPEIPLDVDLVIPVLMLISHFYEVKSTTNISNAKVDDIFHGILWMNRGVVL